MTTCPSCGKKNQLHYKFCLGCGAELSGAAAAAKPASPQPKPAAPRPTPPVHSAVLDDLTKSGHGDPAKVMAVAKERAEALGQLLCGECGAQNDVHHRFCSACGSKLSRSTQPGQVMPRARLTAINPDGSEGAVFPLPRGTTVVGRALGGALANDAFLSPQHAAFTPQEEGVRVRDQHSLNGVYRKLATDARHPLTPGTVFRMGQELIRFDELVPEAADEHGVEPMGAPLDGYVGRIAMVLGRDTNGTAFPVPDTGLNLGRERGEVLFAEDGYVSGLHCRISFEKGLVYLTDLGSSNGTFVRIEGSEMFSNGEVLLMGQQLFRITL